MGRDCRNCCHSHLSSRALYHYGKTGDAGSFPEDAECEHDEPYFPDKADMCDGFIERRR